MGCASSVNMTTQYINNEHKSSLLIDKSNLLFNDLIGEGGFGKVYSAILLKTRNWYAVKEINKYQLLTHKTGLSMLMNELWALQRLHHPFIISLTSAFHDREHCYLVLDLKTGGDLRYYLKRDFVFVEQDVVFYVAVLSSALNYIHSKNIIHRDVKPENIILDSRGYPYLTDFGVAHVQSDSSSTATLEEQALTCKLASGTRQYLAPEVFTKQHVHGPEVDFWSLGVMAYELLFGKRPFEKHCPTPFIAYLENALEINFRTMQAKPKERSTTQSTSSSTVTSAFLSKKVSKQATPLVASNGANVQHGISTGSTVQPSVSAASSPERNSTTVANSPLFLNPEKRLNGNSGGSGGVSQFPAFSPRKRPMASALPVNLEGSGSTVVEEELWGQEHNHDDEEALAVPCLLKLPNGNSNKQATEEVRVLPSLQTSNKNSNKLDAGKLEEKERTCIYGDHWAVCDDEMPHHLRVSIASFSIQCGCLSPACIKLLEGLFEVRPSHRLGGRNSHQLGQHEWLQNFNLTDVNMLTSKQYVPHFSPGKRGAVLNQLVHNEELPTGDENPLIAEEDQKLFAGFSYCRITNHNHSHSHSHSSAGSSTSMIANCSRQSSSSFKPVQISPSSNASNINKNAQNAAQFPPSNRDSSQNSQHGSSSLAPQKVSSSFTPLKKLQHNPSSQKKQAVHPLLSQQQQQQHAPISGIKNGYPSARPGSRAAHAHSSTSSPYQSKREASLFPNIVN